MTDTNERTALQLCELALEQPLEQRDAWLREQCGDDGSLLERVKHLLQHIQPTDFSPLTNSVAEVGRYSLDNLFADADQPPPETVGAYKVSELIGQGGMGAVYKGERADGAFERTVAIKLVGAIRARSDAERRFTNEREILARMRHPNIAQLLDGGTIDGRGYLVMEYVEGEPFAYSKQRSLQDTLDAFGKVCAAVQYAHNNLVLHRDIKPDNVLLDQNGEPKLLDFGIAKLNQEVVTQPSAELTGTNAVPLTLNYSAPERLLGEPASVSSDVYSLGVYLYVLMHGVRPYDLSGKTLPEAWKQLREQTDSHAASTFGDLGLIAQKAMHPDIESRYVSASQLAADLQRYQNKQTVSARGADWRYSFSRFISRHKVAVAASSLGLVLLLGAFVLTTYAYIESARQAEIAQNEATTATQTVEFLGTVLSTANPLVTSQKDLSVADVLAYAKERLEEGDIESPTARAYVESTLAVAHDGRGEYEVALDYASAAVDRLERAAVESTNQRAALYVKALTLVHNDKPVQAMEYLQRFLAEAEAANELQSWSVVEAETLLGNAQEQNADEEGAAESYRSALARAENLPEDRLEPRIVLLNNYGRLKHKQGMYAEAMAHYQQSLDLTKLKDNSEVRQAVLLSNMAGVLADQQIWPDAIELMQKGLKLQADANNLASPDALIARTTLANFQRQSGDLDSASLTINEALGSVSEALPEEHFITAYVQNVAALTFCDTDQWQLGLDYAQRSLKTRTKIMPPEHWVLASGKSVLGKCWTRAGNYGVARELLTEALERLIELRGPDGTQVRQTRQRLEELERAQSAVR